MPRNRRPPARLEGPEAQMARLLDALANPTKARQLGLELGQRRKAAKKKTRTTARTTTAKPKAASPKRKRKAAKTKTTRITTVKRVTVNPTRKRKAAKKTRSGRATTAAKRTAPKRTQAPPRRRNASKWWRFTLRSGTGKMLGIAVGEGTKAEAEKEAKRIAEKGAGVGSVVLDGPYASMGRAAL